MLFWYCYCTKNELQKTPRVPCKFIIHHFFINSVNWALVSAGEVTVCPTVLSSSKISWSFPPFIVLSPKKWISLKPSSSTNLKQYRLSQPVGNTSKLICPPIEKVNGTSLNFSCKAATNFGRIWWTLSYSLNSILSSCEQDR